jgi:hypothetical protein
MSSEPPTKKWKGKGKASQQPIKSKEEEEECGICCAVGLKLIRCPNEKCGYKVCKMCQKTFGKPECMGCNMEFKHSFIISSFGRDFIKDVVKPKIIEELLFESKKTLKLVQPLVEWERECRKIKKEIRFGKTTKLPSKPDTIATDSFKCEKDGCRGFVVNHLFTDLKIFGGECMMCKSVYCVDCEVLLKSENDLPGHQCDPTIKESIAAILKDSKPCPKCSTKIHRTMGCNHMFCTICSTHFDWVTGKIYSRSTNHHYQQLERFRVADSNNSNNSSAPDVSNDWSGASWNNRRFNVNDSLLCEASGFSLMRDRVRADTIKNIKIPTDIYEGIYKTSSSVRRVKLEKYNEETMGNESNELFKKYQVEYLIGDIDEDKLAESLYKTHMRFKMRVLYANVINLYLSHIDVIQNQLKILDDAEIASVHDFDKIRKSIIDLVELCNQSFISIQDEYGGGLLHIKSLRDDEETPDIQGF